MVEAFAAELGGGKNGGVEFGGDSEHEFSRVGFVGLFPTLLAGLQIEIQRLLGMQLRACTEGGVSRGEERVRWRDFKLGGN